MKPKRKTRKNLKIKTKKIKLQNPMIRPNNFLNKNQKA